MSNLTLKVNGKSFSFPALPGETLADLLRNRLRLTGTKIGCNEAECGICTVIVDGQPIDSCIYPALKAQGRRVAMAGWSWVAAFLVLNFVVDNVVKPRFMQSGLDVPPIVGLLSLIVWAYLLGPIGTLLALPLTIAIRRVLQDTDVALPGLGLERPASTRSEA